MTEKYTTVLLPKGEWLNSMLVALKNADLEILASERSYEYSFVAQSLPIIFQAIRSKEVIQTIYDWDTQVNMGFTGSDIAIEQRQMLTENNWQFPLLELNPDAPNPKLYLGSTPNLREKVENPTLEDLNGTSIYTEYPVITQALLAENNVNAKVKPVQGGSEGRWKIDSRNGAIVTIRNTDATMRANEIEPLLDILSSSILFIEGNQPTSQDKQRLDDFRELLYLVVNQSQRK